MADEPFAEVFPLVYTKDVVALSDWAVATLGLTESWRAPPDDGVIPHAELHWIRGKVSLNAQSTNNASIGPSAISLRVDNRKAVEEIHARAVSAGANITQGPEESRISYSFTATDADGNQWWVNAENGFLDKLRAAK